MTPPASFVPDTSCMVAASLGEHEHHERAVAAINGLLDRGYAMLVVGHTLFEAYSTLTRMPPPLSVEPSTALESLERTFLGRGRIITLLPDEHAAAIRGFSARGVQGGQVYDASIVACARARGAEILLTFNERHFRRFEGDGLTIVVP